MDDDYDDEVTVPTLKAPPRFSQRPTPLIPPKLPVKQTFISKYKFYLIGIIIVTVIVLSIIFITKPLRSQVMYEHRIFNLAPIIIPNEIEVTPQIDVPVPLPTTSETKPIPQIIPKVLPIKQSKARDYGI